MQKRYLVGGLSVAFLTLLLTLVVGVYLGRRLHEPETRRPEPVEGPPATAAQDAAASVPQTTQATVPAVVSTAAPPNQEDAETTEAGTPNVQLTNRLADSASPYLRSAANQLVAWQPFGEAAFQLARQLDRPILLDVGAIWCHWCHVMDEETYGDPAMAQLINQLFVPVKVDMDARPDLDRRYQEAVQMLTGQGGWPLTVFMTPDGQVFFGGTYFPAEDRYGRPGFKTLLPQIAQAYHNQRDQVLEIAQQLQTAIAESRTAALQPGALNVDLRDQIATSLLQALDPEYGGFGQQAKFPSGSAIELALTVYRGNGDSALLDLVTQTLDGMAQGGIHDQLGGGFHRYATDRQWHVPHFEIMNYGQAEALVNYLHAYQATGNATYRQVAEGVIRYVNEILSNQVQGGFYASQDADMGPSDDGGYYTWTVQEVREALPQAEAAVILRYYGIEETGDMPSEPARNVLHVATSREEIAQALELPVDRVTVLIEQGRMHLLEARNQRPTPLVDQTILADRNGMLISAYLEAYKVLEWKELRDFALKTLDFLVAELYQPGEGFRHAYAEGKAQGTGLLSDQVEMADALLDAFEVTGDPRYLETAQAVMEVTLKNYWDSENGAFFDLPREAAQSDTSAELSTGLPGVTSSTRRPELIEGPVEGLKPFQDNPTPAPNAVAALVLDRLYYLTNQEIYRQKAEETLRAFASSGGRYGRFVATYGLAVDYHINPPAHAVIIGEEENPLTPTLWQAALGAYRPGKIVAAYDPARVKPEDLPPAVAAAMAASQLKGEPQAYVCVGTVCAPPTHQPETVTNLVETFGLEEQ